MYSTCCVVLDCSTVLNFSKFLKILHKIFKSALFVSQIFLKFLSKVSVIFPKYDYYFFKIYSIFFLIFLKTLNDSVSFALIYKISLSFKLFSKFLSSFIKIIKLLFKNYLDFSKIFSNFKHVLYVFIDVFLVFFFEFISNYFRKYPQLIVVRLNSCLK